MLAALIVGLVAGVASMLTRPLLLYPLERDRPAPWSMVASKIWHLEPSGLLARQRGWILLGLSGAFWGLIYALIDAHRAPVFGSYVLQGLLFGLASFACGALGTRVLPGLRGTIDVRLWIGLFLTDLLFGASLGLMFLLFGPYPAS
jgi:hypothetical protein